MQARVDSHRRSGAGGVKRHGRAGEVKRMGNQCCDGMDIQDTGLVQGGRVGSVLHYRIKPVGDVSSPA